MNNWNFDMNFDIRSAAIGGIATFIGQTAMFLIAIKIASIAIDGGK